MSNQQDKRAQRRREHAAFMAMRRETQAKILQQNHLAGMELFNQVRDTLSADDIALLESQAAENERLLEKLWKEVEDWRAQSEN